MKTLSLFALTALALAACTAPTTENAGAPAQEDELRSASVHSEGFFQIRRDPRKCLAPLCGGVFVKLVNQPTTKCADGTAQAECYIADLDLKALGTEVAMQVAGAGEALYVGKLIDKKAGTFGNLGSLKVSEAWIGPQAATANVDEKFLLVTQERIFCVRAPCPQPTFEKTLNTKDDVVSIGGVSIASAAGTAADRAAALTQLTHDGVIVLGHNVYTQQQGNGVLLLGSTFLVKATPQKLDLTGTWGGDQAVLTVTGKTASIEFGCGSATIDAFAFGDDGSFTATGQEFPGTGVEFPPGHAPKPVAVTYRGEIAGTHMTLEMTMSADTRKLEFDKGKQVTLFHCL